jgi:hypothetical protein
MQPGTHKLVSQRFSPSSAHSGSLQSGLQGFGFVVLTALQSSQRPVGHGFGTITTPPHLGSVHFGSQGSVPLGVPFLQFTQMPEGHFSSCGGCLQAGSLQFVEQVIVPLTPMQSGLQLSLH